MVFEEDIEHILLRYEGKIITTELIGKIIGEYRKLFVCPSWVEDIDKYYKTEKRDDSGD